MIYQNLNNVQRILLPKINTIAVQIRKLLSKVDSFVLLTAKKY